MFRFFNLGVRKKGVVTKPYPAQPFLAYEGSMGMPQVLVDRCTLQGECARTCPTRAIMVTDSSVKIDLGRCIFCGECSRSCSNGAMIMGREFELASKDIKDLEVEYHVPVK
jgi:formate hydrogenlyase subunit 6/NADH:ubiquinone oxidoreductase subunit I